MLPKPGGLLCPQVIAEDFPVWKNLFGPLENTINDEPNSYDDDNGDDYFSDDDKNPDLGGFNILRGMEVPIGNFIIRL